ncbi:MAG: DUF177 domain-containing protein [Clostridia bacterium]|nr:DUF177 domain-containing protein [Clostridia bacterium]
MILDLLDLKRRGLTEESFYFEYSPESEIQTDIPEVNLQLPIRINGQITLIGEHSAIIDAEINFSLCGECNRCLKVATKKYQVEISEEVDESSENYKVVNDKIDFGKIVYDAIIINMPIQFLCKEDCKGICMGCGVNLNDAECKCNNKESK